MSVIRKKLARLRSHGVSRRTFLKGSLFGGLALGLPWQLTGCGAESDRDVERTVHFDLTGVAADLPLILHVGAARYPLQRHDQATRDQAQLESPLLAAVPDAAITHFAAGVALPEAHLKMLHVTAGDPTRDPDHRYLLSTLHLPAPAIRNLRAYQAERAGVAAPADTGDLDDPHTYACPAACAVSLVFQHPELTSADPDLAAVLLAHIDPVDPAALCTAGAVHPQPIVDLAMELALAKRAGGYLVTEPLTEPDGSPLYWATDGSGARRLIRLTGGVPYLVAGFDETGNAQRLLDERDPTERMPAVTYRPTQAVLDKAKAAVHAALRSVKDDPDLEGVCWNALEGAPPIAHPEDAMPVVTADGETRIALDHAGGHDGLSIHLIQDTLTGTGPTDRKARLQVRNFYKRYVGVFVRWLDENGQPDPDTSRYFGDSTAFGRPAWHAVVDQAVNGMLAHERMFFLGLVPAVPGFMGVPESPDWVEFDVPFPATSNKAEVVFASLGVPRPGMAATLPGGFLTGIVNLGIPGYFLYSGLSEGPAGKALLNKAFANPLILEAIVAAGLVATAYGALGDADEGLDLSCAQWAKAVGPVLVSSGCDALRYAVVTAAAESEAEAAIPFVGMALYLAGTAALVSDLAQTTVEILGSDAVYRDAITATWTPTLKVLPDPLNLRGGFPEVTPLRWELSLQLHGKQFHTWTGRIEDSSVDHLELTFPDIPSGGLATYDLKLYGGTDTLVGVGHLQVGNWAGAPGYELTIVEQIVPLDANSVYWHKDKIGLEDGTHRWLAEGQAFPPAPAVTRKDLDCSDEGAAFCAALGLSINQVSKVVGYVWQASGAASQCGGGGASGQLRSVQNLSLTGNGHPGPEGLLRTPGCAYALPGVAVAYDLMGAAAGYHAFVEPVRVGSEDRYLVRRLQLDETLHFGGTTAVARLAGPPHAVAVHPGGYLVSICRRYGKIEIATLDAPSVPDAEAPAARLAAGVGRRRGLLGDPVGIAVRQDGVVLILEAGNKRVSAFDVKGSVLTPFAGAVHGFALHDPDVTPLDIAVEGAGYVYVLSYADNGYLVDDYRLDLYDPDGNWLVRTTGVAAARVAVDHFRNVVTLNYESVLGAQGPEPTISLWVPPVA